MVENSKIRKKLRKQGFPEPISLSEEILDSLSKEQRQILSTLANLTEKEHQLCQEINARQPIGSGVLVERIGITLCEDEDDWKVITARFQKELNQVREEIKQNLNQSLDYGLYHFGLIQRQCENYGVKP